MDKWKDAEIEKMKAGGNRKLKDFLESQPDITDGMSIQQKYNSAAAELYRQKIQTEAQGGTWDESRAKKTVKQSRQSSSVKSSASSSSSNRTNSSPNNNNTSKGFHASNSTPTFQNQGYNSSNTGSYSSGGGGGYQSGGDVDSYNSYDSGSSYQSQGFTFADKKKLENSSRPENLRPSEGGRYTGFGNTVDPQPQNPSNEVLDQALSSLTKGWSIFSSAATKIASTAGENAVKFGGIATQKAAELGETMSEKVAEIRNKGLKDGFSGIVQSASAFSLNRSVGHESIPDYSPSESSSLRHKSNTVPDGNWEDWGNDWGSSSGGGYQSQETSTSTKSATKNGGPTRKVTQRKSDDWSWDD